MAITPMPRSMTIDAVTPGMPTCRSATIRTASAPTVTGSNRPYSEDAKYARTARLKLTARRRARSSNHHFQAIVTRSSALRASAARTADGAAPVTIRVTSPGSATTKTRMRSNPNVTAKRSRRPTVPCLPDDAIREV